MDVASLRLFNLASSQVPDMTWRLVVDRSSEGMGALYMR